ncbi:MAG: polysaccharide biosynthesis tyrosine autokinase [Candidatus Aminicenantes bacterium]|nr:polysaccharide biosynthesis tyrosine autokinase [Candidatus Aminicenantes bacterium]
MDNNKNSIEPLLVMEEGFNIDKYWKIIKPRLHIVIIITLFMVAAAYIKVTAKTPIYTASGLLMIEPESRNIIMFDSRPSFYGYRNEYFNTQIKILQSRTLSKIVMEEFRSTPVGNSLMKENSKFSIQGPLVTPLEYTTLVQVNYKSTDPRAASEMVNLLFDKFIEFDLDIKSQSSRYAAEYIARQIEKLQQNLTQKEEEMQAYGKRKELFYLSREDSTVVEKFSVLNKAYTEAQIDRVNKESVYEELNGTSHENFPEVKKSQLVSNLKNTYSSLESEYTRKSQIFKSSYPEMTQLKSQMGSLQERIRTETRDIAQKTLKEARSEFQTAKKKEESMLNLLNRQKGIMVNSNSDAIYYKTLGIEVDNMRSLLNYLVRKQKESVLSSRLEGLQTSNIKVIDRAQVPGAPINSGLKKMLLTALMLGLFTGFGLIFLIDYLDRTIKTPEEVKTILGVPALGKIPATNSRVVNAYYSSSYSYGYGANPGKKKKEHTPPKNRDIDLINFLEPESPFADDYRTIRTAILLSIPRHPPKIISISSALPSEGKTATTINLAISFSQLGKKVLIIDGDMRKPRMHKVFKIKNTAGLSSYLTGRAKLTDILQKVSIPNLYIVPSGPLPPNPTELIDSEVMATALQKLMERVDFIFIDTPPLIGIVDPILLGKHADGMILVTWAGKTHRHAVEKAIDELNKFNVRNLGVVLNKVDSRRSEYGDYNYSYYSYKYRYKADPETGNRELPARK